MPPKMLGDKPLSEAQKQARYRAKKRKRLAVLEQAQKFVLELVPDQPPPATLESLQRKLEAV